MRRRVAIGALALAGLTSSSPAVAAPPLHDARLDGAFTMLGTITYADNVFGEHRGQRVHRSWVFTPTCRASTCKRVKLVRERSDTGATDLVLLHRTRAGTYVGTGQFWVALKCAGRVIRHGGLAHEKLIVRVRRTKTVGTTPFATAITATYTNPSRINRTRCPGGIGHDAAHYTGSRTSPLPASPAARFTASTAPGTTDTTFTDQSQPGSGGAAIAAWAWSFGDRASSDDSSTQRNPTHHFTAPGIYTVTLTVTDGFGQTATVSEQVTA